MSLRYHMLDYIYKGPESLDLTLKAIEEPIQTVAEAVKKGRFERIILTGIGSSYTASVISAPLFAWYSPVPVQVVESWDFTKLPGHLVNEKTLVVATSRSGERGFVVDSLNRAVQNCAYTVAITGVADSLMTERADLTIVTREGPEITYPKTKSVVVCAGALMRLALALAEPNDASANKCLLELRSMPAVLERTLADIEPGLKRLIPTIEKQELIAIVGTGSNYGVALEGALKVQESSGVPTYGSSTCSFLTGFVGAMTRKWLVITLVTSQDKDLSRSALHIARSLGARTLCVIAPGLSIAEECNHCLTLPIKVDNLLAGLVYLLPMQLLAYFLTMAKGMNPDAPASMNIVLEALLAPGREEPELCRN
jgi:glucosamine--fructose-6-phosphate aminotransferase (isomerizing)